MAVNPMPHPYGSICVQSPVCRPAAEGAQSRMICELIQRVSVAQLLDQLGFDGEIARKGVPAPSRPAPAG